MVILPDSSQKHPTNGYVSDWNCTGLSGSDLLKKNMENEKVEGNVQAMKSNEGRD